VSQSGSSGEAIVEVALIVAPGFDAMSLTPLSIFEIANSALDERYYRVHLLSEDGGLVRNSLGLDVMTAPLRSREPDTLVIGASQGGLATGPVIISFLQNALPSCRRLAAIGAGVFAFAEAGILDGRRATTHWRHVEELRRRFPNIRLEPDRIYIADGPVWTSAGMMAGVDLALELIERDLGAEVTRIVAKTIVIQQRRAGGQSQQSVLLDLDAKSDRVQNALTFARRKLDEDLSVERLAEAARLSPRQFSRVFRAETGQSPARAIERLRLEAARFRLEQGRLPVATVAEITGFGDRERMRRAFLRVVGQTPRAVRDTSSPFVAI
jgi:transcriptional regulator GlxA family with amidase domain